MPLEGCGAHSLLGVFPWRGFFLYLETFCIVFWLIMHNLVLELALNLAINLGLPGISVPPLFAEGGTCHELGALQPTVSQGRCTQGTRWEEGARVGKAVCVEEREGRLAKSTGVLLWTLPC